MPFFDVSTSRFGGVYEAGNFLFCCGTRLNSQMKIALVKRSALLIHISVQHSAKIVMISLLYSLC